MRGLLFRQKKTDGKWFFEKGTLAEDTSAFSNPARGWYQIYPFLAEQEPDFDELEWRLDKRDALALVFLDIGAYRERDLDAEGLDRIRRILDFFARHGYDVIVRAAYDREGRAMEKEPWFFRQVLTHLEQLGELLKEHADSVFVFQGMLVGSWGEMHSSRFLSPERMGQMAAVLRRFPGKDRYLAVRRPVYWRALHDGEEPTDGMGLFDDGLFGSESDLGTFGTEERGKTAWDSPWRRSDELAFENRLCRLVPNGGEAVFDGAFQESLSPERIVEELGEMQITYLNKAHDARQLDAWRKWKYTKAGAWCGKSLYDYIGAHLGYRFLIRSVSALWERGRQTQLRLRVEIENVGFAAFYQEAELFLECERQDGETQQTVPGGQEVQRQTVPGERGGQTCIVLERQMKGWLSRETRTLSCAVPVRECEIFLAVRRKRDGACIRFANSSDQAGRVRLGALREGKSWRK